MKTIVLLITILMSSFSYAWNANAAEGSSYATKSVSSTQSGLSNSLKVVSALSDDKIKKVAIALCRNVNYAKSEGQEIPPWKNTMKRHLGFKGNNEEFKIFFHHFINTHKNKIICPQYKVASRIYPSHHLFKRLLAVGMDETYEEYFFELEEGDVDFNAYEIVDGKKETVLDWVEKWIALGRGDADQLRDIAYGLADEYGAKKGSQL